jgi:hypothetical protein
MRRFMVTWYDGNDSHVSDFTTHNPINTSNDLMEFVLKECAQTTTQPVDEVQVNSIIEVVPGMDYDKELYEQFHKDAQELLMMFKNAEGF